MSEARHKTKIFGLANNTIRRHATLSCSVYRAYSAANRLIGIGEVVQSQRRSLLGPSPG